MKMTICVGEIKPSTVAGGAWTCNKFLQKDGKKVILSYDDAKRIQDEFKHLGVMAAPAAFGAASTYAEVREILSGTV